MKQPGSLAAVTVDVGVAHDRQQPCPWVGAVEGGETVEGTEEGVLDQVFGVVRVSAWRAGDPE